MIAAYVIALQVVMLDPERENAVRRGSAHEVIERIARSLRTQQRAYGATSNRAFRPPWQAMRGRTEHDQLSAPN